ncbi:MAG: DUF167 domain-containing protein [Anaerolineae bacterium]|nr:DUF167 domain-containing protein [Anaerolineae bacterium]
MSQNRKFEITDARGGAAFAVRVVTRAAASEIVGTLEDGPLKVLKIRLMASPAGDPAANDELLTLLAEKLQVDKSRIEIVAGAGSREKMISVEGITTAQVEKLLGGLQAAEE